MDRLRSVVLALALMSTGCQSENFVTAGFGVRNGVARIVGVTFPDSARAGSVCPFTVHWLPADCSERVSSLDVVVDSSRGRTILTVRTIRALDVRCPAGEECVSRDLTFDFLIPSAGGMPLLVSGLHGAVTFDWNFGALPTGPGHVVELRRRPTGPAVAGVQVAHRSYISAGTALADVITDSVGMARSRPGCSVHPDGLTYLVVEDSEWGCGEDIIVFDSEHAPCRRALKTILLYGPAPLPPDSPAPVVARDSRAATYSAGNP